MKRRNFIKSISAYSTPLLIGGIPISIAKPFGFNNFINGDSDRILVLIQLNGGNDGLNTVMQLDNYDNLAQLRSNILIPENQLLNLSPTHALHPSMTGIKELYDEGMVNIIQNVGYANQNRSHFRSMDIWTTASAAEEFVSTGWLSRHLKEEFPGYPDDFPNTDCPDPLAITIGNFNSETCQGVTTNYSIAVGNLDQIIDLDDPETTLLPDNCYGREMEFLIESIQKTNAYASRLTSSANLGVNVSTLYDDNDRFAAQLKTTAKLISGGLQTKLYVVSIGGFDTHADQVQNNDPSIGTHANLWASLSKAIRAFFDDMSIQGFGDNILCMTYSEFGRQIRSNASFGTDHGAAAPLFVFGNCVNGGVIGDNISIPLDIEPQAGVPMQFDFRDVYGTVLENWFDAEESTVKSVLYEDYQALNLFNNNCLVSATDVHPHLSIQIKLWPNPAHQEISIELISSEIKMTQIEIHNSLGGRLFIQSLSANQVTVDVSQYPAAQYFCRFRTNRGYVVKAFVKI